MPKEYPTFNVTGRSFSESKMAPPVAGVDYIQDLEEMRKLAKSLQKQLAALSPSDVSRLRAQVENLDNQLKKQQEETLKWKNMYLYAARVQVSVTESDKDQTIARLRKELADAQSQAVSTQENVVISRARRPNSSYSQKSASNEKKTNEVTPKTEDKTKSFAQTYVSPYAQKPPKKQKQLSPLEQQRMVQDYAEESMLSCYNLTPLVEYVGMDVKTGKLQLDSEQHESTTDFDRTEDSKPPYLHYRPNRLNQGFAELFNSTNTMEYTCFGDTTFAAEPAASEVTAGDSAVSLIPNGLKQSYIDTVSYVSILTSGQVSTVAFTQAFPLTIELEDDACSAFEEHLTRRIGLCSELLFVQPRVGRTVFIGTSILRKEVCRILREENIKFSGLQLCSCVVYGKTTRERVQQVGRAFNCFDTVYIDDGFEVQFENETDAQRFYTLGQMEFASCGAKGLTIARKAKQ